MNSVTIELEDDLDAFGVGSVGGLLWSGDGYVFGGLGVAERIPLERSTVGAVHAQERLSSTAGPTSPPGVGPIAFTAMPFDPSVAAELVVPEILIGEHRGGRRWMTITGDEPMEPGQAVEQVHRASATSASGSGQHRPHVRSVVPPEVWQDEIVLTARTRIRQGELTKVVLARELEIESPGGIDQRRVLFDLAATHSSATIFCLEGFLGASPERLVSRIDDVVLAHPLAGTMPRGSDRDLDQAAIERLLASTKDRAEHRITIDWLLDELLPFCSYVDAEPEPSVVSLPNVHHLGTEVEGRLSSPPASILELVATLHPTPAVGGDPQGAALDLIAELERADRGRYAGPMGWVDSGGNGSFVVAIRSAQITDKGARLFAGVGVVADSDPEAELIETEAKFQALLPVLTR
ncbi:MAG: isochorismate synthase [Acidimicrobiales bacterium]